MMQRSVRHWRMLRKHGRRARRIMEAKASDVCRRSVISLIETVEQQQFEVSRGNSVSARSAGRWSNPRLFATQEYEQASRNRSCKRELPCTLRYEWNNCITSANVRVQLQALAKPSSLME